MLSPGNTGQQPGQGIVLAADVPGLLGRLLSPRFVLTSKRSFLQGLSPSTAQFVPILSLCPQLSPSHRGLHQHEQVCGQHERSRIDAQAGGILRQPEPRLLGNGRLSPLPRFKGL